MPVTYDPSTNIITVIGFTAGNPCSFETLYNADKNGTLTLVERTNITDVDSEPVDNTYPLRPADDKVLGGNKHDLWLEISNWSGFDFATIRLIGKDEAGNDQTEDITVTGDGIYYSSKLWTELTQTQVVSVSGSGSFDYKLVQGRWGVISKNGEFEYEINCGLIIGDGSTETWFKDADKKVVFNVFNVTPIYAGGYYGAVKVNSNANFILGEAMDVVNKIGYHGCCIYFNSTEYVFGIVGHGNAVLRFYDTKFFGEIGYGVGSAIEHTGHITAWDCTFTMPLYVYTDDCSLNHLYWNRQYKPNSYCLALAGNITVENPYIVAVHDSDYAGAFVILNYRNFNITIKNAIVKASYRLFYNTSGYYTINVYMIDTESSTWYCWYSGFANIIVWRQYTFNLKIVDRYGNPMQGLVVKIYDKDGNLVVSTSTDANGDIPEVILTYGYYDYYHQTTPVLKTPHTLKVYQAGSLIYEIKFVADKKMNWVLRLPIIGKPYGIVDRYKLTKTGSTIKVHFMARSGDTCKIYVYKPDGTEVISGDLMSEIDNTGIYTYDLTFDVSWGSGDFLVRCVDENELVEDSIIITVLDENEWFATCSDLKKHDAKMTALKFV